jgi:hypothetical protein
MAVTISAERREVAIVIGEWKDLVQTSLERIASCKLSFKEPSGPIYIDHLRNASGPVSRPCDVLDKLD